MHALLFLLMCYYSYWCLTSTTENWRLLSISTLTLFKVLKLHLTLNTWLIFTLTRPGGSVVFATNQLVLVVVVSVCVPGPGFELDKNCFLKMGGLMYLLNHCFSNGQKFVYEHLVVWLKMQRLLPQSIGYVYCSGAYQALDHSSGIWGLHETWLQSNLFLLW